MIPSIQPTWTQIAFNGSLLKENIYRQSAGEEVDAAWEALGVDCGLMHTNGVDQKLISPSDRPVVVPEQSGKAMGLHHHVRVNEKYGGGFPANIEGLHHLHCLVRYQYSDVRATADCKYRTSCDRLCISIQIIIARRGEGLGKMRSGWSGDISVKLAPSSHK